MTAQTILLILLTVLLGFGSVLAPGDTPPETASDVPLMAVVGGEAAPLYADALSNDVLASLSAGESLMVLDSEGARFRVRTARGREGYVSRALTRPLPATPVPADFRVLGYYMHDAGGASRASAERHADTLTEISPWSWGVTASGRLVTVYFDERLMGELLTWAGRHGLKTHALIHNFNPVEGRFDPAVSDAVLSDPSVRRSAVRNIVDTVVRWGMSGVHVDFEGVPAARRDDLTAFISDLARHARAHGLEVSMAVPAKTAATASGAWSAAYDYRALAAHVDFLMIMAYDQHWRGDAPGPVAALPWVRDVIEYTLDPAGGAVPPEKVVLGVPVYGYDWPAGGEWADAVTHHQAMSRLQAFRQRDGRVALEWHPDYRSPYFTYAGRTVWFENEHSITHKVMLAAEYGLGGVAFWRLGQEDERMWDAVRRIMP